jgi:hypothetical protein
MRSPHRWGKLQLNWIARDTYNEAVYFSTARCVVPYVMPTELASVVEVARDFVSNSGYLFSRLERANFDEPTKQWKVVFDVGVKGQHLKVVTVDGATGKVIAFE